MSQLPVAPAATTPAPATSPTPAPRNSLSADVEIKGTILFQHDLVAHGKIEGEILTDGNFTLGKTGTVDGDIKAGSVSIHGSVNGNVAVNSRCELKGDAQLFGDLEAPTLIMEEGATFVGRANVTPVARQDLLLSGRNVRR